MNISHTISVYFMDIMGDFASMLQWPIYSSISKWRLRDEWANNISGNFAKFSPNCILCFLCYVVLWTYSS
jgi:hypothetical protein